MLTLQTLKYKVLLLLPLILIAFFAISANEWISPYCVTYHNIVISLPYILLTVATIFGQAIKQTTSCLTSLLLLGCYFIIQTKLQAPLAIGSNWLIFMLTFILLPINLLLSLSMSNKSLFSRRQLIFLLNVGLQLYTCSYLVNYIEQNSHNFEKNRYFESITDFSPLPLPVIYFYFALILLCVFFIGKRKKVSDVSVFTSLLFSALTSTFFHLSYISSILFSLASCFIILNLIFCSRELAFDDPLTQLPSRRALEDDLKNTGSKFTIAMLDIDHFKKFNDTYGHSTGDNVLKLVAELMRTVRGNARIYRYGGEEFTILFNGKTAHDCTEYLDELRKKIANYKLILRDYEKRPENEDAGVTQRSNTQNQPSVTVTVSIGIADNCKLDDPIDVMKAADKALYKAKDLGRNRISVNTCKLGV